MKVDIAQRHVDTEKLNKAIQEFEIITNQKAYLFMNRDTALALTNPLEMSHLSMEYSDVVMLYAGNRVYFDRRLGFGEVEIR